MPKGIPGWQCNNHNHRRFQPRTQAGRDAKVAKELERMQAHAVLTGGSVNSRYLSGEAFEQDALKKYPPPDESYFAEDGRVVSVSSGDRPLIGVK